MPRDATGGYTLPAGNPVVTGTLISSGWANPTMDDIKLALTDSLSRSGNGGMLAPFTVPDGSNINPSLSFVNEATSGLYRFGANDIRMAVGTVDRMRWQGSGTPPQIYDEVNNRWNDLGAGGVDWRHAPVIPVEVEQGVGYMTRGGQSTLMPASPITGQAVTFSDLDNDWSETNFLTLDGNGSTFTQGSQTTYDLDLKGAFAQFAYLDGQWQIVNFGRLSDAYGFDLDDYATLNLVNSKPNDNLLINGGFDIWQRGDSFTGGTSRFMADHWACSPPRTNLTKGVDQPDEGYYLTTDSEFVSTLVELNQIGSPKPFVLNGDCTVTIRARGEGVIDVAGIFRDGVFGNANDQSVFSNEQITLDGNNTDWVDYVFTFNVGVPPVATNACFVLSLRNTNTTTGYIQLSTVKLELGSVATPYQPRPIAEEFALCQRYYQEVYGGFLNGAPSGAQRVTFPLPVEMRTNTYLYGGKNGNLINFFDGTSIVSINSITVGYLKKDCVQFDATLNGTLAGFSLQLNDSAPMSIDAEIY